MLLPLLAVLLLFPASPPQGEVQAGIRPRNWLVLAPVDRRGRRPFRPDAVFRRFLLDPRTPRPAEGETLTGETGKEGVWTRRQADEEGRLQGGAIGYAWTEVEVPQPRVFLAELRGASTLFVNGAGFAGDLYSMGVPGVPVLLHAGRNSIFVTGVRGSFRLRLLPAASPLVAGTSDATRPDFVVGTPLRGEASVLVLNASRDPVSGLKVVTGGEGPFARREAGVPGTLDPLCVERVILPIALRAGVAPPAEPGSLVLPVSLSGGAGLPAILFDLDLAVRAVGEARRHTFRSGIDGSLQEFTLLPPAPNPSFQGEQGLVLSLHGAGVDAFNQARSYAPKPDFWILAPTNRRPFGFDWQDWGREDAYEALDHALAIARVDPRRVYLTGHSMGGHGAWHLAVNDPDRFAAVAPSAGWASFDSYTGRPEGKRAGLWKRADGASLTEELLPNLAWEGLPIYVLHGTADDNVPVSEARELIATLRAEEPAPHLDSHFQEGAGHWWNGDASPGVDCVDWPPIFETFRKAPVGEVPAKIEFLTVDPAVDARHHWIEVAQPLRYGHPIHVRAEWDSSKKTVAVVTENARRLRVDPPAGELATIRLDGTLFQGPDLARGAWFLVEDGAWRRAKAGVPADEKTPRRSGPFKRAFDRGFLLVYGTRGNPEEDQELFQRARYDSEVWSYRANGNAPLYSDAEFLEERGQGLLRGRNVILYGNRDTNAAWTAVFGSEGPLRAERGRIRLGTKEWKGPDLACLFVRPRKGDPQALAAAFADSGPRGTRLGYTLAPFISGVGYPDYVVFGAGILSSGDGGVLAAGWFDVRWNP